MLDFIKYIERKLECGLPGKEAQEIMAPSLRNPLKISHKNKNMHQSAVLLLLYPRHGKTHIVFIERPKNIRHGGQISFPGGRFENSDKILSHTAKRETLEEIGVPIENIQILGALSKLSVPVSNFCIQPYLGYSSDTPDFIPNNGEVTTLIEVPLEHLLDPINSHEKNIFTKGIGIIAPYYNFENFHIWGATAMILSEFLELIKNYFR